MNAPMTRRPRMVAWLSVACLSVVVASALAYTGDMKTFRKKYSPKSPETRNCVVCHLLDDETQLNAYGRAFLDVGGGETGLQEIEGRDSDRDGYSNRYEIRQGSNPGQRESIPQTGGPDMKVRPEMRPRDDVPPPYRIDDDGGDEGPGITDPVIEPGPGTGGDGPGVGRVAPGTGGEGTTVGPDSGATIPEPGETPGPRVAPGPGVAPGPDPGIGPGPGLGGPGPGIGPDPPGPAMGGAPGVPNYPILYATTDQLGSFEVHLLQDGQDLVVSQGIEDIESWGWSAAGMYPWFVGRPATAPGAQPATKAVYVVINGQAVNVSGDVLVDSRTVRWMPDDSMVLFIPLTPPGPAVLYGVTMPGLEVVELASLTAGRFSGFDVAPTQ